MPSTLTYVVKQSTHGQANTIMDKLPAKSRTLLRTQIEEQDDGIKEDHPENIDGFPKWLLLIDR